MSNEILSVTDLNRCVAHLLEQEFGWVSVEGEISNLARPASGHIYFSLKDSGAQIRCAMFRGSQRRLQITPDNGMQVMLRGKVSLYQPRGDYQLIVDSMQAAGAGLLQQQFEALKAKLHKQGLFDEAHKQALPEQPVGIAVITSPTGAAIRDVLSVIGRRFPSIPVRLYSVPVQGESAAPAICRALANADTDSSCDVILLVRGGGSLEDLWAFNEEIVAQAIYQCETPVVSGVGHEIDFTIADFVADARAATPSAAAEMVTPDQQAWFQSFDWYHQRLQQLMQQRLEQDKQSLQWLQQRLQQQHPLKRLQLLQQQVRFLSDKLISSCHYQLQYKRSALAQCHGRLQAQSPSKHIEHNRYRLSLYQQTMQGSMQNLLHTQGAKLARVASTLQALSPLQTLARGYSITSDEDGHAVLDSRSLKPDQVLTTRLHNGEFTSRVMATKQPDDEQNN